MVPVAAVVVDVVDVVAVVIGVVVVSDEMGVVDTMGVDMT